MLEFIPTQIGCAPRAAMLQRRARRAAHPALAFSHLSTPFFVGE
jgi:hypothetical protein